jgi:hypothetical protein
LQFLFSRERIALLALGILKSNWWYWSIIPHKAKRDYYIQLKVLVVLLSMSLTLGASVLCNLTHKTHTHTHTHKSKSDKLLTLVDKSLSDITDGSQLDHRTNGVTLDGLVLGDAARAVGAADGLDVAATVLVASVVSSLDGLLIDSHIIEQRDTSW